MAEIEVKFDVTDLGRQIRRFEDKTRNLPMDLVGTMLLGAVEEMFETEGAAGTQGAWRPFETTTLQRHPRRIGGMLLQDTGATANVQIKEVAGHSVSLESPPDYAGWHLIGTGNMVQRDFFAIKFGKLFEAVGDELMQEYT